MLHFTAAYVQACSLRTFLCYNQLRLKYCCTQLNVYAYRIYYCNNVTHCAYNSFLINGLVLDSNSITMAFHTGQLADKFPLKEVPQTPCIKIQVTHLSYVLKLYLSNYLIAKREID